MNRYNILIAENTLIYPKRASWFVIFNLEGYIIQKSFSLSAYTLRIKNKEKDSYEKLDKIGGDRDIFETLDIYLSSIKEKCSEESILYSSNLNVDKAKRLIKGLLQTGVAYVNC
jgi:hypothetical protein